MRVLKNLLLVLSTGYIFVYFSERLFWARPRGDSPAESVATWLAYSLIAFSFLILVTHFRVKNLWALFLAGAVVGWLAEGVLVQTTYEALPLSLSWTGLAWHALFTVWIGWYALQRTLHAASAFSTLKWAAAVGFVSGVWAIMWWTEPAPDGGITPLSGYAVHTLVTTLLLIVAYWLANWSASEPFAPNRWATILVAAAFLLYFLLVAVPAMPLAMLILPLLLALVYFGLQRNRRVESEGSFVDRFQGTVSWWRLLSLLALPLASMSVYALAFLLELRWQLLWVFYLVTTPLGFILFGVSLYRLWKAARLRCRNVGGTAL